MSRHKVLRYLTFGSLYFTQGTILGFFAALNALYLLENGLNMTDVGIFGFIALLPFVLKIGLGILSDRVNLFKMGHRKPYILIGLAVQLLCLVAAPFINPSQYFWGYVAMAFTLQMGMALYDTCTDGLALDTTPLEEQSTIQGFMVGGRALGTIVAASAVGILAENVSWLAVFWVLAALTLLPVPLVFLIKEKARSVEKRFNWQAFKAFDGKTFLAAGLGLLMFMVILGVNQLINPFLEQQFGISLTAAGLITSLWGLGVVGGSLVGGWLLRKYPAQARPADRRGLAQRGDPGAGFPNCPQIRADPGDRNGDLLRRGLWRLPNGILCRRHASGGCPHRGLHVCDPDGLHQHRPGDRDVPLRRIGRRPRLQSDLADITRDQYLDPAIHSDCVQA